MDFFNGLCGLLQRIAWTSDSGILRALKKYIKSEPVRKEKAESAKSLGEVIKRYRTQRKMTQEFVAESLGVSRQAESKWESGTSDPSTTN